SAPDPPDRESVAAKTPDAHVLRLALARNREADPRVPAVAKNCRDRPAREPGGNGDAICLRSALAFEAGAAASSPRRSAVRYRPCLYPDQARSRPARAPT